MTATEAALERAIEAAGRRRVRWEPVGLDYPGWPTLRVRDRQSGATRGVYEQHGAILFSGSAAERVTDPRLRRIFRAAFSGTARDRGRLIDEMAQERKRAAQAFAANGGGKTRRRKR